MSAISLFSGMCGYSLGIVQANLKLLAYSEKESLFRKTHDANFNCDLLKDTKGGSDITNIPDDVFSKYQNKVDLVFAGFPCQGFSNAGKKDVNDVRNTMFREFLRCVILVKPKYIIGENVKGLISRKDKNGNNYIDVILDEFKKAGYNVSYKIFNTEKYGIPQKRERLIIAGIRNDINKPIKFPEEVKEIVNLKKIVKFNMKGAIKITPEDFLMSKIPKECILTDEQNSENENNPHPYLTLKVKSRDQVYTGLRHHSLLSFGKRDSPIHCEIIDIRKPCKTIICTYSHQPRLFVPLKNKNGYFLRCLLPDELKQIQGFPSDYKLEGNDSKQIIQIGNAVPPILIKQVVETLLN